MKIKPFKFTGIHGMKTGFMGIGFGLTVPAINTFAAAFFPANVDKAVLALNALLGLGTALAPVFVAIFTGLGIWWGLPILTVVFLASSLVLVRVFQRTQASSTSAPTSSSKA